MPVPYQPRPLLGPPLPPMAPHYVNPQHIVHVLLTLFSFGLWLPIWMLCAWSAEKHNGRARAAYEQACLAHRQAYWHWQHGH